MHIKVATATAVRCKCATLATVLCWCNVNFYWTAILLDCYCTINRDQRVSSWQRCGMMWMRSLNLLSSWKKCWLPPWGKATPSFRISVWILWKAQRWIEDNKDHGATYRGFNENDEITLDGAKVSKVGLILWKKLGKKGSWISPSHSRRKA